MQVIRPARACMAVIALMLLPLAQGAISEASSVSALSADAALLSSKNRPVSKVIKLLKDMLKQLEKEQEEDEEIYDKMACWCETNDKEKTKAIAEAEEKLVKLNTEIEELVALSAQLTTEIKNLEKEVAQNQDALDKATSIRQKQLAEFNEEEKDSLESISALKAAIVVLEKHHPSSMLQVSTVAATVKQQLQKHASLLNGALTHAERKTVESFLQQPSDYFDAEPTFKQAYAPQSGEIFGILKQMKETFEANLADSQKEEMENQKAYQDLKAAKEAEINAGQAQIESKHSELADTDEKKAQAEQDMADTKVSLAADEKFLAMLKEKCAMTDQEWEERQKTRQLEMEAVSKALAVLSTDDAHDLFTRTFNTALVQKEAVMNSERRTKASQLLSAVAKKLQSPRLATLATRVRLDAFTKVKQAIDEMISQLTKEKADEIKHKDWCREEFNTNAFQTEKKEREKAELIANIEELETAINKLTTDIETLKGEIEEMQVQLKRAGEDREKENKDFQLTVTDQRETQKLLKAALGILRGFYGKVAKKAALDQQEPAGPPPPKGFEEYKKNAAAPGVMGMIEQIINDAKAMEAEAFRDEEDAQKTYEEFVKDSNASIDAKSKEIVTKDGIKAKKEADLVEANEDLEAVNTELDQLAAYKGELHESCDFVLKNFEIRQTARDEEIEALKQAKAILSGAKFEAFLQGN